MRFAVPDWEKLLQFRKKYAAIPVVWFRLAMENDRLCLELENLRRLDAGLPPRVVIECFSRRIGVRTELFWRNHGVLGEQEFRQFLGGGTGEAFFFHGVHPVIPVVPGCVPRMICGPIPGPGETLKIGRSINGFHRNQNHAGNSADVGGGFRSRVQCVVSAELHRSGG
ncbi:MAG: hypothetical protein L6W00_23685 [Lentisphaeria bacterium]|nr:MAG: hypothetical protein L6W00_23685 [Lentisphaeria bacterium]